MHSIIRQTWPWKAGGPIPPPPKPISMKTKASIQAPIMIGVGALIWIVFDHRIAPIIIWTLAALVFVGGWFVPPIFRGFERFGLFLAKWVGLILTYGLLVPFYYLVFLPGGIITKLAGRDPMKRSFQPGSVPSYWEPRKPVTDMERYKKQH